MANTLLPPDFKDFLKLLNENDVRYLLIGAYALGYHGHPRAISLLPPTHTVRLALIRSQNNAQANLKQLHS
jgi:hypothetical protein